MRQFFITVIGTVFGIFAFLFLSFIILIFFGVMAAISSGAKSEGAVVLTLDMRQPIQDHSAGARLKACLFAPMNLAWRPPPQKKSG